VILGGLLAAWPAGAVGQEGAPLPPITDSPWEVTASSSAPREVLDRLRKLEQCLDRVTKQNEDLARENKTLAEQFRDLSLHVRNQRTDCSVSDQAASPMSLLGGVRADPLKPAESLPWVLPGGFSWQGGLTADRDDPVSAGSALVRVDGLGTAGLGGEVPGGARVGGGRAGGPWPSGQALHRPPIFLVGC
jgi:hypothetical protein